MEIVYNLSMLFDEEEFDAQKGYNRFGSKEAYFAVLYRFTRDCEALTQRCISEINKSTDNDVIRLAREANRLQGVLANIGAINLALKIQKTNHLVEKKLYVEYMNELGEILPDVDKLRLRIIGAEKRLDDDSSQLSERLQAELGFSMADKAKDRSRPRLPDFEKLVMLIDNFEFESADKTANELMRYSYSPEIDASLCDVSLALHEFNFTKSLEEATRLLGLVTNAQESAGSQKKNILAIDDMPDVLRTVKTMLKDKYNVFGMTNYESAVKFLRSNTADLILLDIEMPGLDGFAMMQLFRKIPEYAKTPIVFLTGNVSDEHIKMARNLGASDFIKKPVDLAVLVSKLEAALL